MGQNGTKYLMPHLWKEDEPASFDPIKYDPMFGFEGEKGRKEKTIRATEDEMDSGGIISRHRDQCAHLRLVYQGCIHHNMPFYYLCKGYYNELSQCYYEDRIDDMKEFEREKRLNARERRLKQRES